MTTPISFADGQIAASIAVARVKKPRWPWQRNPRLVCTVVPAFWPVTDQLSITVAFRDQASLEARLDRRLSRWGIHHWRWNQGLAADAHAGLGQAI